MMGSFCHDLSPGQTRLGIVSSLMQTRSDNVESRRRNKQTSVDKSKSLRFLLPMHRLLSQDRTLSRCPCPTPYRLYITAPIISQKANLSLCSSCGYLKRHAGSRDNIAPLTWLPACFMPVGRYISRPGLPGQRALSVSFYASEVPVISRVCSIPPFDISWCLVGQDREGARALGPSTSCRCVVKSYFGSGVIRS